MSSASVSYLIAIVFLYHILSLSYHLHQTDPKRLNKSNKEVLKFFGFKPLNLV
jgi:hypothetical protein